MPPSAATVLLVGPASTWAPFVDDVRALGARTVTVVEDAADLDAQIAAADRPLGIVGTSWAAVDALEAAARHPDAVDVLLLLAPALTVMDPSPQLERAIAQGTRPPAREMDTAALAAITAWTTIAVGAQDLPDYAVAAGVLSDALPRARRKVVAAAGHDLPGDVPEATRHLLERCLTARSTTTTP